MMTGVIKFFLAQKNYGFIQPHDGGKDVMFHQTALEGVLMLKAGQWVQFADVIDTPRGPKALRVALCAKRGQYEREKVVAFGTD
jgi:CspA family cold shock protein